MNLLKRTIRLASVLIVLAIPLQAQRLDPDWCLSCRDSRLHFAAGAGIQTASIVILPKSKTYVRLLVNTTIQVAYELGQESSSRNGNLNGPGYGFGFKDLLCGFSGALLTEGLNKWVFRL